MIAIPCLAIICIIRLITPFRGIIGTVAQDSSKNSDKSLRWLVDIRVLPRLGCLDAGGCALKFTPSACVPHPFS